MTKPKEPKPRYAIAGGWGSYWVVDRAWQGGNLDHDHFGGRVVGEIQYCLCGATRPVMTHAPTIEKIRRELGRLETEARRDAGQPE
jgi:hypothetical protein